MNTLLKLKTVRAILMMALVGNTLSANAMKRSYEEAQEQHATTTLPLEVLQKILGFLPTKYSLMSVCKAWNGCLNFKTHWLSFVKSNDIARTLHLTKDARLRIYRLLLVSIRKDDTQTLAAMLANDPNRSIHLKEIATITRMPLLNLTSNTVKESEIVKDYREDFLAIPDAVNNSSKAETEEEICRQNACVERITTLCDILLRDDQDQLDRFLADPTLNTLFNDGAIVYRYLAEIDRSLGFLIYNVDFLIDNDLITRFCSISTVKKLIPLLQQIVVVSGEDDNFRLTDYLLYRALFGTVQRLDIADELLRTGANWKFRHPHSEKDYCICSDVMNKQDPKALELLVRYGLTLNDLPPYISKRGVPDPFPLVESLLWMSVYRQQSAQFIQLLIDLGDNLFTLHDGENLLDVAKRLGNTEIVQVLEKARLSQAMVLYFVYTKLIMRLCSPL